ncbi:MAG: hypothetical protein PIR53_00625 [Nocardioides alkalitolerans]
MNAGPERRPPRRWKTAVASWLAVYPLITLLLWLLRPLVGNQALPVQTLVLTLLMVPLSTFVTMPLVARLLGRWLRQP